MTQKTRTQHSTEKRAIINWMGIFSAGQVAEKFFMFGKIVLVAYLFGISRELDDYLVAMIFPTIFFNFVGDASFIYVLAVFSANKDDMDKAWEVANVIITLSAAAVLVFSALYVISLPWLYRVLAFRLPPEDVALTIRLSAWLAPLFIIYTMHAILKAMCESFRMFGVSSFSFSISNGICIAMLLGFGFRWGIKGYVWATLASEAITAAAYVPQLMSRGFRYRPDFRFALPQLHGTYRFGAGLTIGSGIYKLAVLINRIFASFLPPGAISVFNYANNFIQVFASLLRAFVNALFPSLTQASMSKDTAGMRRYLEMMLRSMALVGIPLAVFIGMLREPLIMLLRRGEFDARAVGLVSGAVLFLTPCILLFPLTYLQIRVLIVFRRTKLLFYLGAMSMGLMAAFNALFMKYMSVNGLSLGNTASMLVTVLVTTLFIQRDVGSLRTGGLPGALARGAASGAAAAAALFAVQFAVRVAHPQTDMLHFAFILIAGGIAAPAAALGALLLLRTREVFDALDIVKGKLPWRKR